MTRPVVIIAWYWIVGGDTSRVYSSALGDYVPIANPAYQAWLAIGNTPTNIDTEINLGSVLTPYLGQGLPPTSNVLIIQQALKQAQLDALLLANADMVHLIKGGQLANLTGTGVANYLASATNNYRSLRTQIASAANAAAVQAININAGWPANP